MEYFFPTIMFEDIQNLNKNPNFMNGRENMDNTETIILNLNGKRFELFKTTWLLMKKNIPLERRRELTERHNDVFIQHSASAFQAILNYYLYGRLHMPGDTCPSSFKLELEFWGIEPEKMAKCCYQKYVTFFDDEQVLRILETDESNRLSEKSKLIALSSSRGWGAVQGRLWLILNEPFYSTTAKVL